MIYVTGDTHGNYDISKLNTRCFPEGKELTRDDYVIILGDFGLVWDNDKTERYWRKWLNEKPWTTLWLDGNHENFDQLSEYPTVRKFGDHVTQIEENIFHLKRGRVYDIDGNKCLVIGGAESIDREHRTEGKTWWSQEKMTIEDIHLARHNLAKVDNKVDYVFTHTCPHSILNHLMPGGSGMYSYGSDNPKLFDPACMMLEDLSREIEFKHWYFGHLHMDESVVRFDGVSKYTCLYYRIIELGETL